MHYYNILKEVFHSLIEKPMRGKTSLLELLNVGSSGDDSAAHCLDPEILSLLRPEILSLLRAEILSLLRPDIYYLCN